MWFLPKKQCDLVTISCTPDSIACAWMRPIKEKALYELKGYKRIVLDRFELNNGYIHNPTMIEKQIISFLAKHTLHHAFVVIGLRGPRIYENIVTVASSEPDPTHIASPSNQQQLWEYRYLYTQDNAHTAFYICKIPQSLIFQYQLLGLRHQLNFVCITTLSMAYLNAYAYGYGAAFRHTQLAQDMARCGHMFEKLVAPDIVKRRLVLSPCYSDQLDHEIATLTPLLGLAISQRGIL